MSFSVTAELRLRSVELAMLAHPPSITLLLAGQRGRLFGERSSLEQIYQLKRLEIIEQALGLANLGDTLQRHPVANQGTLNG